MVLRALDPCTCTVHDLFLMTNPHLAALIINPEIEELMINADLQVDDLQVDDQCSKMRIRRLEESMGGIKKDAAGAVSGVDGGKMQQ